MIGLRQGVATPALPHSKQLTQRSRAGLTSRRASGAGCGYSEGTFFPMPRLAKKCLRLQPQALQIKDWEVNPCTFVFFDPRSSALIRGKTFQFHVDP
jgi:hypothetical protein